MSRANDSAYDSAFTDSEAGTLSDIMSDFDLAASINGAVSLNGIDELRELKESFQFTSNKHFLWCLSMNTMETFERMVSQMCLFLIPV